jgi:RimJ/RimL family protein N-acetyltransferase
MKSKEELELELRSPVANYPGFDYPLTYRPIKIGDAPIIAPVLRSSARSIRGYLGQYQNADLWDLRDSVRFVSRCVADEFPSFHYLFFIGHQLVGMGSLHPYRGSLLDVQVVLAVFGTHYQGRGIGTVIGQVLKKIAFDVWGFETLWWLVDATNRPSIAAAQKVGLFFHHQWEDEVRHAEQESGLWMAFTIDRPDELAPGILQGGDIQYWATPKNASTLRAVIEGRGRQ